MAVDEGEALHRLLFPVGPRQQAALLALSPSDSPERTFLVVHRGFAAALDARARSLGASGDVLAWIRLEAEGAAADLLWNGERRTAELTDDDLGDAYAKCLDPDLRHRLGEHYTPMWLVRSIAKRFAGSGMTADPACGDGRFLVAMLDAGHPADELWAADLNPLAVMMARINVWDRLGRPARVPSTPVIWGDFILGSASEGKDVLPELTRATDNIAAMPVVSAYIGNPPWVTWRNLSDGYRRALTKHLATSRLNHARGWSARVSAGQTDLSHIFVHDAVERVGSGGRLGFVLPRAIFKAPIGPGRVRDGVTTNGRPYTFSEVWDCVEADPFTGVRSDAVVAFAVADTPQEFPVPWLSGGQTGLAVLSDPDDPASPWLTPGAGAELRPLRLAAGSRWSALRGRGGINTGGGNSVFYVEVLSETASTLVIRNIPSRRQPTEVVTAEVERAFVRPLLRGKDVRAWSAVASSHIVLPHHESDLRKPVNEAELATVAPLTYAYLLRFKDLLAGRKELARWPSDAWFTLFRIGPYTAGCWRVVWPHSANGSLRAAVLAPNDRSVPDQKVVLVAFEQREPAVFLAALLNSTVVRAAASGSAGMDASPNLVRRLVLPAYEPERADHREIVERAETGDVTAAVSALFR